MADEKRAIDELLECKLQAVEKDCVLPDFRLRRLLTDRYEEKERLERRVGEIVRRVIAELPPDLRTLAERVPVFEEVRLTYIHEFGHCLGLDESELEARRLL